MGAAVTDHPSPGEWGLVKTHEFMGWLIREGTHRPLPFTGQAHVNHAFIFIGEGDPRGNIIEMRPQGACYGRWERYGQVWWSMIPLTTQQRAEIVWQAKSLEARDCDYSFLDIGAISLKILHITPPGLNAYITDTKHMICSQSVDFCYCMARVHIFDDKRLPGMVTPEDLFFFTAGSQPQAFNGGHR